MAESPSLDYLAVYGSLAPGKSNHEQLQGIKGRWLRGEVEGDLHNCGWGAATGYPGIIPKPGGPRVPVWVLESVELADAWDRLDAFEGDEYERVKVPVFLDDGKTIRAHLYALRAAP